MEADAAGDYEVEREFRLEGTDRTPQTPGLQAPVFDASLDRLFVVEREDHAYPYGVIEAFAGEDLQPAGMLDLHDVGFMFWGGVMAHDELGDRLFLVVQTLAAHENPVTGVPPYRLVVVDLATLTVASVRDLPELTPYTGQNQQGSVKAMSYYEATDKLYLATQHVNSIGSSDPSNYSMHLHQVDVGRLAASSGASPVDWSYHVPTCYRVLTTGKEGTSLVRTADYVAIPCKASSALASDGLAQRETTAGIARVTINETGGPPQLAAFRTEFFPVSGKYSEGNASQVATADPISGRLFLPDLGTYLGKGVWVFDVARGYYAGLVQADFPPNNLALDPKTGQLHVLGPSPEERDENGRSRLIATATNGRADKVEPGLNRKLDGFYPTVTRAGAVDSRRGRAFIPVGGGADGPNLLVVRSAIPPPLAQPQGNPDLGTVDVAEKDGLTVAAYTGRAGAHGFRASMVGGTTSAEIFVSNTAKGGIHSTLGSDIGYEDGTRELTTARVVETTLSNGNAYAAVLGAELDPVSAAQTSGAWDPTGSGALEGEESLRTWPYEEAQCSDSGFGDDDPRVETRDAVAECDLEHSAASGSAHGGGSFGLSDLSSDGFSAGASSTAEDGADSDPSSATVGAAGTSSGTRVYLDPEDGMVSEAWAEARGIDLFGLAGIDRITTVTRTQAKGRPDTASSTFERTIEGAWVADPSGERSVICEGPCDPDEVAAEFNRVLDQRVRVDFPQPDSERAAGTPGGFEAVVSQNRYEHINDEVVHRFPETRTDVDGMRVTAFYDGFRVGRLIFSFAAVRAESHYGIQCLFGAAPSGGCNTYNTSGPTGPGAPGGGTPGPFDGSGPGSGVGSLVSPFTTGGAGSSTGAVSGTATGSDPGGGPSVVPGLLDSGNPLQLAARRVAGGLAFLFASPWQAMRTFAIWLLLAHPLMLAMRRRYLIGVD